ncbi:BZ3500_MvSof-1268-A1-R1_Chr12-2g03904 [Microbotryum saponariae]|uniref:BZ3500_MvSof-1268-A1-R1_Chr12-2g03904 protein n=1 Tax=Microbotryum saponariae TaxID=289078 RepID=A0A2X0MRB0_9BASI|nr:BZ3500_MvSof-1268-A1-R1_Chr12-2g03904 [Microbotryum saponariae]
MPPGTGRSSRSTASSSHVPREDNDVYQYALRFAVLHSVLRAGLESDADDANEAGGAGAASGSGSASASTSTSTITASNLTAKQRANNLKLSTTSSSAMGSSLRPADGWTNALLSVGDVFRDSSGGSGSGKSVKFPKEFVKVLDGKLVKIFQGSDPKHDEKLFRATVGAFYGTYKDKSFQTKLLQNRGIEEIILTFVTIASGYLRKRLEGDEWKEHLNQHVAEFVMVLRDGLKLCRGVPSELLLRLDSYCSKMQTPASAGGPNSALTASTNKDLSSSASTGSAQASTSKLTLDTHLTPPIPGSANVQDMPMVLAVGKLFGKSIADLNRDYFPIRRTCTEQSAFNDLKLCINNVAKGARFPARREDFDSDESFSTWRKQESDTLQEYMLNMIKRNPNLVRSASSTVATGETGSSTPLTGSPSLRRSVLSVDGGFPLTSEDDSEPLVDPAFVFVPPDPKFYYRRLYEIALNHDYEAMRDLPPDQDVSLTILSPLHEELLSGCATRWRIMAPTRAGTFLSLIGQHYKFQAVPEACVAQALSDLAQVVEDWEYARWPWADRDYLFKGLSVLFDTLLSRFFEVFQGLLAISLEEVVDLIHEVHTNEVFREDIRDLDTTLQELQQGMRKFIAMMYEEKQLEVIEISPPGNALHPFLAMLDWITAEAKSYDTLFPNKFVDVIDPPALFLGIAGPWFVQHLNSQRQTLLDAVTRDEGEGGANDADILDLYRAILALQRMHGAFCPKEPLKVEFSSWFEPYIRKWLQRTDAKTTEWVKAAIHHDTFEPEGADGHSSSIIDLIDSCRSATDFILKLNWPDSYDNARYLTALSQTIAKSIERYASALEAMFIDEMYPRGEQEQDPEAARPSAWLTKAKMVVQGDKKIQPFVFKPELLLQTCVKLNNIQAARKLLDIMYTTLDADNVSRTVEAHQQMEAPQQVRQPTRYLFTVKILLGENLAPNDSTSRKKLDPFLILSDPQGYRVAKTRTLYDTNDPRWDETIDISVKGDLWLRATVYNRNLVESHDNYGCAYVHLDPKEFSDFMPKDLWFQLEDTKRRRLDSRISFRISMEVEKDDIQFYFGRAFRWLKRAESDMVRIMVDKVSRLIGTVEIPPTEPVLAHIEKMSPFVRHYISRNTLKALVKTSYNFDIDLDKVRGDVVKVGGKLNAYVRDAINGPSYTIPPVEEYGHNETTASPSEKKKGRGPLTDLEIEDAIGDLFDYFNDTFGTLKTSLSQDGESSRAISLILWKDILTTIEGLIVPPLSDRPTPMKMMSEKELDIVFKWLGRTNRSVSKFLVNFFHSSGDGVPLEDLRNAKYRELVEARMYWDWTTDQLMEESVRSMQRSMLSKSDSLLLRSKSVYQQRNLGTIRARKIEKKQTSSTSGEMILRILRMHSGTSDFIAQQLATIASLQQESARRQQGRGKPAGGSLQRRPLNNGGRQLSSSRLGRSQGAPAVPKLPTTYGD